MEFCEKSKGKKVMPIFAKEEICMKICKKIVVLGLCIILFVTSTVSNVWRAEAKTYEAADFGLGYDVEKYVGVKFIKVTKKYVVYKKYIFNGNDGLKSVNNKKYKKKFSKKIKMYVLKPGYPSTWTKVCNGFTYKNIKKYKIKDGDAKLKDAYWIIKGNKMMQYYTP